MFHEIPHGLDEIQNMFDDMPQMFDYPPKVRLNPQNVWTTLEKL